MLEQLRVLAQQFPRSKELAVSASMVEGLEQELVAIQRFSTDTWLARRFPVERLGRITAQRVPINFRDRHLVRVDAP